MKLYICGDSFCVEDPEYGQNWVGYIRDQLPHIDVVNLSSCGASNYLIYLQAKHAIESQCDFLICNFTSSVRQEIKVRNDLHSIDSVARYYNSVLDNQKTSMICGSWIGIDRHYPGQLDQDKVAVIENFFKQCVDFPNLIEKNYLYIKSTLNMIADSTSKPWAWSQGGFEHASFANASVHWEFDQYATTKISANLWDYYDPKLLRPYYHVTNSNVHQNVCNQYIKMLQL